MPGLNGFSLAYSAAGGILLWSGIAGTSISDTFRSLVSGQAPTGDTEPIGTPVVSETSGTTSATAPATANTASENTAGSGDAANQAIGALLAAAYGWGPGTQNWTDLLQLWNEESGWNNTATNGSSGAYGIAQALNHGQGVATQGSVANEYGNGGLDVTLTSEGVAQDANSGSASAQITWGLAYIKAVYGSPSAALTTEGSAGGY